MSGPTLKKNSDKLNTIAIVTVGLTGAALVYLSIIGIEAWYLNETSAVDQVAKFGKQEEARRNLRAAQLGNINEPVLGPMVPAADGTNQQLYTLPIATAKELVVRDAKVDAANLVPAIGRSVTPTIQPAFGRPKPLGTPAGTGALVPADPGAPMSPGAPPPPGTGQPAPPVLPVPGPDSPTGTTPSANPVPETPGVAPGTNPSPNAPTPGSQPGPGSPGTGGYPAGTAPPAGAN